MARRSTFAWKLLAVVAFALLAGGGSAWWWVQHGLRLGAVTNGPWSTNEQIGSATAGPYLRAGVAVAGLLALGKSETVYYTAFTDSGGEPLRASCVYAIEGTDPAARWWSVTAYGADHFLIPNAAKRYAVAKTNVVRAADGRFAIRAGGPPQERNWIAAGAGDAPFSLTLRLYNPAPEVIADLAHAALPRIRRESCT